MPDRPTAPRSLDDLSILLAELRAEAGSPSYAEIGRRIAAIRNGPPPAKVTVYDCFRPGRRRLDEALVADIARVLGMDAADARQLGEVTRRLNGARAARRTDVTVGRRDVVGLMSRDDVLTAARGAAVAVLTGLPGVGKSAVASLLVAGEEVVTVQLQQSEPEHASLDPVDVLRRMLGALGERSLPYALNRLRERLLSAVEGRTVVLEDAASAELVAPLIVPGVRYVITARGPLTSLELLVPDAVTRVTVPPLSDGEAQSLLHRLLGPAVDAESVARIARLSAGLPLDLVLLAEKAHETVGWSAGDLAERFEAQPRASRMDAVLENALSTLAPEAADLLQQAALIAEVVELGVLRGVLDSSSTGLRTLADWHLGEVVEGRLQLHPMIFAFARERALARRPVSERRAAAERAADAVLVAIERDSEYAGREYGTVAAVTRNAAEHGLEQAARIALAAHPLLAEWGHWQQSLGLLDAAAQHAPILVELHRAVCVEKLGRVDEALMILHKARRIAAETDRARVSNQLASVHRRMGRFREAVDEYQLAADLAHAQADAVMEGRARGNRADTLRILGRFDEALAGYDAALAIADAAADRMNIGIVRTNRALLYVSIGRIREAEADLLDLLEEAGARPMPHAVATLALVTEATRNDRLTAQRLEAARAVLAGEFGAASELVLLDARIRARSGQFADAVRLAERVLDDGVASGSPILTTQAGNTLAGILLLAGDLPGAARRADDAEAVAELNGDVGGVAHSHAIRAEAAARAGHDEAATELRESARTLYRSIGHRLGDAEASEDWFDTAV